MVNRVDLPLRAVHGAGGHAAAGGRAAEAARADRGFARELRRFEASSGGAPEAAGDAPEDAASSEVASRVPLGERRASDAAPATSRGLDRLPLGAARGRRPIGTGASTPGSDDDPSTPEIPRGPQADDEPVKLSSRGGYRNAADYIRDQGWTKHPDALYPDPAKPGYWIDPVTGRSGNFPPGYVPGMPLGDPGNAGKDGPPSQPSDPASDPLAVEMARLGMDPEDRLERMQFVASVDEDMRNWLNQILEKRGMAPVEERPLDELSDEMASELQERRDKKAQRAEVLADLAEGNGSVRGGPGEGTVPVFEPDGSETA
jgi:hypothetical protein